MSDEIKEIETVEEITILQPSKEGGAIKFDPKDISVLEILLTFTELQGLRVGWFKSLDNYFKSYTENKISVEEYRSKNEVLKEEQKKFTHHCLALINNLKDEASYKRPDLGDKLENILKLEKLLLETTAQLQTATVLDATEDRDYSEDKTRLNAKVEELRKEISEAMFELHEDMADLYEE
ncbi:hypothetical protein K502DRAFT_323567 [Neoconidiobolus thromboides FSU 785]|nr:hypothetical protein K502DRAFT_323567 [Neoconidiobolus thromboides FSU 785]